MTIAAAVGLTTMIGLSATLNGAFSHGSYYERLGRERAADLLCLNEHIAAGAEAIHCPNLYPGDLMPAYMNLLERPVSFGKYLTKPLNMPYVARNTMFQLTDVADQGAIGLSNARRIPSDAPLALATTEDPQFVVSLGDDAARECTLMQVIVAQRIEAPSPLEVYFVPRGGAGFSPYHVRRVDLDSDERDHRTSFFIASQRGFEPMLRIDPVADAQAVQLDEVAVGCVRDRSEKLG